MSVIAPATLNGAATEQLRSALRGRLITPVDPEYEQARRVYNGMIDRRPALIARCTAAADVSAALRFARSQGLAVAVRGGGHHGAGLSTLDGGLVIDLSPMRSVQVDPDARTLRVEGGALLQDMDRAGHEHGLAVPSGFNSTTGVAGLTLGGGVGYLTRRYGLTLDNLLGVEMVLADGSTVRADERENADLFWAVRGGGGNFGVVTAFTFRGSPVHTVYGGPIFWPLEATPTVLPFWRDLMLDGPEELNAWFGFRLVAALPSFPEPMHGKLVAVAAWCWTGALEAAEPVFRAIRAVSPPLLDRAGPIVYPALQSMFDAPLPSGLQWYWRTDFVKELPPAAIALHMQHAAGLPTPKSAMNLFPVTGAAQRVAPDATAWRHRDANFVQVMAGVSPEPADAERITQWARDYWTALHPYASGGAYVNMTQDFGDAQARAAYGDNYARLAAIKARYDPENVFRLNQNIQPAA